MSEKVPEEIYGAFHPVMGVPHGSIIHFQWDPSAGDQGKKAGSRGKDATYGTGVGGFYHGKTHRESHSEPCFHLF